MNSKTDKKQFIIFLIAAYGVTYLMGLLMWYGNTQQLDLSAFANTQMMYPATGVMLAYLLTRKDDLNLPKWFFRIFTVITLFMLVSTVMTVIQPESTLEMPGRNRILMAHGHAVDHDDRKYPLLDFSAGSR